MIKRVLAVGLTIGLAAAVLTSCGSSKTGVPVSRGTVFSFLGDAPLCDVLTFRATITGMTLTPFGGGSPVTVISSTSAFIKVNFAELRDFSTVLNLATVPAGTYDKASIKFSSAQMVVYDPTRSPPLKVITVTLSNSNPTVNVQPALTVTQGQVSGLQIDFDLRHSIQLDSLGRVTGNVTPVLTVNPVAASTSGGFGDMDDVLGFVERVDTFSSNLSFVGDLGVQLLAGSGPSVTVNLTSASTVCQPPTASNAPCSPLPLDQLNQLLTGSFVEVDGFVDTNGNFVANSVDVEDQEVVDDKKIALLGYVASVTKDSGGNLTQFSLYVREEEPDDETDVALDSIVVVNVSSSTLYQFSSRASKFTQAFITANPNLSFDSTTLNLGQEVVVHGVVSKPPTPAAGQAVQPTTDAADMVYLKLQTHEGHFASLLRAGSDDKTGAFRYAPCASLFGGAPMMVLTNSQTAFVNVNGLSELAAQPSLLVKGLLFFEPQATAIDNVAVPAGTYVLLAKQVHQLP